MIFYMWKLLYLYCLLAFERHPQLVAIEKKFQLWDMTGEMPGVEKVGPVYFSELCRSKPRRLLSMKSSGALNIKGCLQDSKKKCLSIKTNNSFQLKDSVSTRRVLLKGVPLKKRSVRGRGWLKGHPSAHDTDTIEEHVLSSRNSCYFISTECLRESGLSSTQLFAHSSKFPHFEKRSWGTCALVGLSDDLLLRDYGEDIDAHDVVIRMGHLPIEQYKRHVGSRSEIVIYRPGALKRDYKKQRPANVIAYLCRNPNDTRRKRSSSSSRKTSFVATSSAQSIFCDKNRGKNDYASSLLNQIYASMSPTKKSTTGTLYAIRLAFSRLCNRLDIYGISSGGGGTYFAPEAITKLKHGTELDSWLLHYLMKNYDTELKMCIYT